MFSTNNRNIIIQRYKQMQLEKHKRLWNIVKWLPVNRCKCLVKGEQVRQFCGRSTDKFKTSKRNKVKENRKRINCHFYRQTKLNNQNRFPPEKQQPKLTKASYNLQTENYWILLDWTHHLKSPNSLVIVVSVLIKKVWLRNSWNNCK